MKTAMTHSAQLLLAGLLWTAPSQGVAAEAQASAEEVPEERALKIELTGTYSIWALNQHAFLLGRDHPLDDAAYVVQNARLGLKMGKEHVGAQLRLDAAQGWWGVDNSPNTQPVTSIGEDGALSTDVVYNPYALFEDKDTNYAVHVDRAFIYFDIPHVPARVEVGRQYQSVGNKLVLDYEYDGLDVTVEPASGLAITGLWSKLSEGLGSYRAPVGALMSDDGAYADADLFGGVLSLKRGGISGEAFGLRYVDRIPDHAYLPEGLGYVHSRFQPQVATATALGLSASGAHALGGGLKWRAEVDYLMGTDDIANADYGANLVDINDGTLRGFNLLGEVRQTLAVRLPLTVGLLVGMGSGDADPTSGPGNLNRIQTMGLFHLTNVWEDSVMPDIGGISPQGLGSPVSRGYRELENTTVGQLQLGIAPTDWLGLDLSYAYLQATQPVHGWDGDGPTAETASHLGQEVDVDVSVTIWKELKYKALFGYFIPGDAAGLLINGDLQTLDPAWELKQMLLFTF